MTSLARLGDPVVTAPTHTGVNDYHGIGIAG
jgi:hypothetical protein